MCFICTDSQVALSWVVSKCVKTKNVFATNRVKDIASLCMHVRQHFGIECKFKYVSTDLNPADLITRGMSFAKFQSKMDYWQNGPEFLRKKELIWPFSGSGCFSDYVKSLVNCSINACILPKEIFPENKYSDLNKLLRVTSLVLRFVDKLRKQERTDLL